MSEDEARDFAETYPHLWDEMMADPGFPETVKGWIRAERNEPVGLPSLAESTPGVSDGLHPAPVVTTSRRRILPWKILLIVGAVVVVAAAGILSWRSMGANTSAPAGQSNQQSDVPAEKDDEPMVGPSAVRFAANNRACVASGTAVECFGAIDGKRAEPMTVEGIDVPVLTGTTGRDTACVVDTGFGVWCWQNSVESDSGAAAQRVGELPAAPTALTSGIAHSCAIVQGDVWCWGSNKFGQIKGAVSDETVAPLIVLEGKDADALATSGYDMCAETTADELWCWGNNKWGQIDPHNAVNTMPPTKVDSFAGGEKQ